MHYMCGVCVSTCSHIQYNSFCKLPQLPNLWAHLTYSILMLYSVVHYITRTHIRTHIRTCLVLPVACLSLSSYQSDYQQMTSLRFALTGRTSMGWKGYLCLHGSCCKIVPTPLCNVVPRYSMYSEPTWYNQNVSNFIWIAHYSMTDYTTIVQSSKQTWLCKIPNLIGQLLYELVCEYW